MSVRLSDKVNYRTIAFDFLPIPSLKKNLIKISYIDLLHL